MIVFSDVGEFMVYVGMTSGVGPAFHLVSFDALFGPVHKFVCSRTVHVPSVDVCAVFCTGYLIVQYFAHGLLLLSA